MTVHRVSDGQPNSGVVLTPVLQELYWNDPTWREKTRKKARVATLSIVTGSITDTRLVFD